MIDQGLISDAATLGLFPAQFTPAEQPHLARRLVVVPRERILMYGDAYNPPAGDDIRNPERGPDYAVQIVQRIQELKLSPERIAPVQGRVVPDKDLLMAFNLDGGASDTR